MSAQHDLDAERSILGGVLLDPLAIKALAALKSSDFYNAAHRQIFAAMLALDLDGSPIDRVTVKHSLAERGVLATVGEDTVDLLDKVVPNASHLAFYAEIVSKHARTREAMAGLASDLADAETPDAKRAVLERAADKLKDPEEKKKHNPLRASYRQLSADDILTDPPPQQFILRPYIPSGVVSILSGPGGGNKTTLTIYIAVCRALGLRFFGGEVPPEGETVIVSTEDRIDDYRRKLGALRLELGAQFNAACVAQRLHFVDLSGVPCRMVRAEGGQYAPTGMPEQLAEVIAEVAPRADHVVMETISRLTGGVETNESLSILVESSQRLCRLRESVGLGVTLVGHVSQEVGRNGNADAYAGRGGSALGDNGRSSLVLQKVNAETLKKYRPDVEVSAEQLDKLRVLTHPKSNGCPGAAPLLLQCGGNVNGPILRVPFLNPTEEQHAGASQAAALVGLVSSLTSQGVKVTESILRGKTGTGGVLGSKHKLPLLIAEAVAAGLVLQVPNEGARGGGMKLVPIPAPLPAQAALPLPEMGGAQ